MAEKAATKETKGFDLNSLNSSQKADFEFFNTRIKQLQSARENHYGRDLDKLWSEADRDYIPHRLNSTGKKVLVEDETKGWRSSVVQLGSNNWQSDISQANPFIKIQTALAIMVDQNPGGVFTSTTKKYQATNELIKQLYQRSWEYAKSKTQLKLFVFNLAKYGWAVARTYPLKITRKVKVLKKYDPEDPENSEYEEKEVVEYNDIYRENIDVRNAWIDDMAKPNNSHSIKDWAWRKVYDFDAATEEFGKYKNWKFVKPGGVTDEVVNNQQGDKKKELANPNLVEVYFYENRLKDLFMVIANGVPVIIEPLPVSDTKGNKKLSCWQAYWILRHAESPYGIGLYEAMRYDNAMIDRVRNMSLDQLTLSIYKMFFYQGTQALTETGDVTIAPGVGKQTLDPKNINFLEVPGPGKEAVDWMGMLRKDLDEVSGITDPLLGQVTGKTAFELAQAKESALKRLKDPLDNILEALNLEGYITVSLIQLLYSIPETYKLSDTALIEDYLKEVESDPDLWERDEEGNFTAKVYPEFPLNLEKDEKGNLQETNETAFFRVKPAFLQWEGIISIKSQSLLTPSKQIDKALDLEMYNAIIPLLPQDPQIYGKVVKSIIKLYDKDPRDILPSYWLLEPEQLEQQMNQDTPLIVPVDQVNQTGQPTPTTPQTPAPASSSPVMSGQPQSLVGKIMGKMSAPFRRI